MALTFRKLHPSFVAEVSAVDLRHVHDRETLDEIRAGMDQYAILVFRDQPFADWGGVVAALKGLGLSTVGEVASLPPGSLLARGGAQALGVHHRARGADESPFVPSPLPEVLEETLALDWPAEALEPVLFGLKTLVDRLCARARQMADGLAEDPGVRILNDVVLNQVLVRFGDDDDLTRRVITAMQDEGTCWLGGTTWQGRAAMRISVSNWATSPEDAARSVAAILGAWRRVKG